MNLESKDIIIPIITGLVASYATHLLTIRTKRSEMLLQQRVAAFSALHKKLVSIHRYCQARSGEESGSDLALTTESLVEEDNRGVLGHWHDLQELTDANCIYFPARLQRVLTDLCRHLSLASSIELAVVAGEVGAADISPRKRFDALADKVKSTIEHAHKANPIS